MDENTIPIMYATLIKELIDKCPAIEHRGFSFHLEFEGVRIETIIPANTFWVAYGDPDAFPKIEAHMAEIACVCELYDLLPEKLKLVVRHFGKIDGIREGFITIGAGFSYVSIRLYDIWLAGDEWVIIEGDHNLNKATRSLITETAILDGDIYTAKLKRVRAEVGRLDELTAIVYS